MFKIISAIATSMFLVNFCMCLYLTLFSDFGPSIGFGLLSVISFGVMAITGYYGLNNRD